MKVKKLKKALENVDDNLEIIVIDGNRAKEYKIFGCSETEDTFLREHPEIEKQFILSI